MCAHLLLLLCHDLSSPSTSIPPIHRHVSRVPSKRFSMHHFSPVHSRVSELERVHAAGRTWERGREGGRGSATKLTERPTRTSRGRDTGRGRRWGGATRVSRAARNKLIYAPATAACSHRDGFDSPISPLVVLPFLPSVNTPDSVSLTFVKILRARRSHLSQALRRGGGTVACIIDAKRREISKIIDSMINVITSTTTVNLDDEFQNMSLAAVACVLGPSLLADDDDDDDEDDA